MNQFFVAITLIWSLAIPSGCDQVQDASIVPRPNEPAGFSQALSKAALERTKHPVRYDPRYIKIPYPNGDVPEEMGVCTDVVIRAYRGLGVDLQKDVHEEMSANFNSFPNRWGLKRPDPNIDHRRVPNLQVLFKRKGRELKVTSDPSDYVPGDIVTWDVEGRPHIGVVVSKKKRSGSRYLIVHNIGLGPKLEDMLFEYKITGHYRYYGSYKPNTG